jgi:general secretion pathway protein A
MYLSYYNLKSEPFTISAGPKFLWLGEKHKEAFPNPGRKDAG